MRNNLCIFFLCTFVKSIIAINNKGYEAQLYEDLLYDYNKIPRPVKNSSDVLLVDVGASLIRIIDVDEKNQVLTTNVWLEMRWTDIKLQWDPAKYGGIKALHIPISYIWSPDIVLYNNAAGDPDITIFTDAHVLYNGRVYWQPPAIYKSFCSIDITWFPYDLQNCNMKFGAWSYTGFYVDLRQLPHENVVTIKDTDGSDIQFMENGMDLSFFYESAEWDLLSITSARHSVLYASCCGPEKYVDITYYFVLRRKTLFFTSNLVVPCFLISFLTTFVFYLSDHKITFSISILITLTVFFLVLIDLMPPTSLVVPMFSRYLTTTLFLVSLSTLISVVSVNFRYRSGAAYQMSPWIRRVFLQCLPKLLLMKRPEKKTKPILKKDYTTSKLLTKSLSSLLPTITFLSDLDLERLNSQININSSKKSTSFFKFSCFNFNLKPKKKIAKIKDLKKLYFSKSFSSIINNDLLKDDYLYVTSNNSIHKHNYNKKTIFNFSKKKDYKLLKTNNNKNSFNNDKFKLIRKNLKTQKLLFTNNFNNFDSFLKKKNFVTEISYFNSSMPCSSMSTNFDQSNNKNYYLPLTIKQSKPAFEKKISKIANKEVNEDRNKIKKSFFKNNKANLLLLSSNLCDDIVEYNNNEKKFNINMLEKNGKFIEYKDDLQKKNKKNLMKNLSETNLLGKFITNKCNFETKNKFAKLKKELKKEEKAKILKLKVNDVIFANVLSQIRFVAEYFRQNDEESDISDDWTFVAMVLDRLFLIIFSILNVATFSILLEAPALYDSREPLNVTLAHSGANKPLGVVYLDGNNLT